jgi:hypothetical protein
LSSGKVDAAAGEAGVAAEGWVEAVAVAEAVAAGAGSARADVLDVADVLHPTAPSATARIFVVTMTRGFNGTSPSS